MLIGFFAALREAGIPVSVTEFLTLLEALKSHAAGVSVDDFYILSRACLVKDERHYDRFDLAFGAFYRGRLDAFHALFGKDVPEEWLRAEATRLLSDAERHTLETMGWERLMDTLRERLAEQTGRHSGGNRWIGTGGTSPFGHSGFHPAGVRIGGSSQNRRAVKVWENREYRNLDDRTELGTRNLKLALRKLRRFARTGARSELDLDATIRATAQNAGLLDVKEVAERHNAVKVLLLLDIGGSMDDHIRVCEQLFSAARAEFKHLQAYYFHNFIYERVWRDNRFRHSDRMQTVDLIRTYGRDYKLILVGDASMSPYEITQPGGSVDHFNAEPGAVWLRRLLEHFNRAVWLNPVDPSRWAYTPSVRMTHELMAGRMAALTLDGMDQAVRWLRQPAPTSLPPLPS